MFTTYQDVLRHLDALGLFHMDLTLERMYRALRVLDLERPPFRVVQIAGTNGKGSTATFLEMLARTHGLRTGLSTSPHFVCPGERIRINGIPLPPKDWPGLATEVYRAAPDLTYFEFLTVLAVLAFARAHVDLGILEAGLGGRWDASTAVTADVVCFTPIGMDHEQILGTSLQQIATDKACALRPGMLAITAAQPSKALCCLEARAKDCGVTLHQAADLATLPPDVRLGLRGPHQRHNALTALAAWTLLHHQPDAAAVRRALASAFLPGRLQHIPADAHMPELFLDGAHNPHGLRALRSALADLDIRPRATIFSCMKDKNISEMLPVLREICADAPIFIPKIRNNPRAADPADLVAQLHMPPDSRTVLPAATLEDALDAARAAAPRGPLLICGSLYLLSEFFAVHPQYLEAP